MKARRAPSPSSPSAFAFVLLFGTVACAPEGIGIVVEIPPAELPSPPPAETAVAAASAPMPMRSGDEWIGTYTCAQGRTDLALHVGRVRGDAVDAVFEFSHRPSGAEGAFEMRGRITAGGDVGLEPGPWIRRPEGYVVVGMHGQVRGASFAGRIDGPGCSGFSLVRR